MAIWNSGQDTQHQISWPWQVQLVGTSMCGGTLISRRTVLTATHCMKQTSASDWQISAGHLSKNQTIAARERGFQDSGSYYS